MPFTDAVSSVSGRNSRSSNVSGMTGASSYSKPHHHHPPPPSQANDTLNNAGVLSMLKTSTDTGDIGLLSFNSSRLPGMPRATHQRRGNHGHRPPGGAAFPPPAGLHRKTSSTRHKYAHSQTSKISSLPDDSFTQRRGSFTSMQSMPPSLAPTHSRKASATAPPQAPEDARNSRSYSLSSAPTFPRLPRHRSVTSLKSQGHEPRQGPRMPPGPVPPMPEIRPAFAYPTRLKRPGYRAPSPALSETYSNQGSMSLEGPVPRRAHGPRPPGPFRSNTSYTPETMLDYPPDPRYLNAAPQHRHYENVEPATALSAYPMPYHRGHNRSPVPPMEAYAPRHPTQYQNPPLQHSHYRNVIYPQKMGHGPMPPRPFGGPQVYTPKDAFAPVIHPMLSHDMRMGRQVPMRFDTPMTDNGVESSPPSTDPPSSRSAPTSSGPSTPKDHTAIQVMIDPAFIDPALHDLPESSSEPALREQYLQYTNAMQQPVGIETEIITAHPSVPTTGFVQRVKAMLESKAAVELPARNDTVIPQPETQIHELPGHDSQNDLPGQVEIHELPANETPRFTVLEEFNAPVELPASPIRIPELEVIEATTQPTSTSRITVELARSEELEAPPVMMEALTAKHGALDAELNHPKSDKAELQDCDNAQELAKQRPDSIAVNNEAQSENPDPPAARISVNAHTTMMSVDASLPSGAAYALRFTSPAETTAATDETQSENPFALDADTITIENRNQEAAQKRDMAKNERPFTKIEITNIMSDRSDAVSPLHPGEEVDRCSAVSPLPTLGINETLRFDKMQRSSSGHRRGESMPGAFPIVESSSPTSTPRASKRYSKSVQIRPSVAESDTTNTNRLSLLGDLSTMAESTMNTTSDMATDVAVRFSLPQATTTLGRPQIVGIIAANTSSTEGSLLNIDVPPSLTFDTEPPTERRDSVVQQNEIAPLQIKKNNSQQQQHHRSVSVDGPSTVGTSIMRRFSPRDNSMESSRTSRDSTTDIRLPGPINTSTFSSRTAGPQLPDLKEESMEDLGTAERLAGADGGRFSLLNRIAAVKAIQDRRLHETADKAKARRAARQYNRPLADAKDLPSLNFSRIDLIDKLNEALEVQHGNYVDPAVRPDFSGILCPSPQRPQSTEPLRERYMSFFCKPEDFDEFGEPLSDVDDAAGAGEYDPVAAPGAVQGPSEHAAEEHALRTVPSDELIKFASQVNRLSVPSVNGLSERLSELIPGLRNLQNFHFEELFPSNRTSDVPSSNDGPGARPGTLLSTRSSMFRSLAERAEEIVNNGTHDSLTLTSKKFSLDKDLPPLPGPVKDDGAPVVPEKDGKRRYLSGSASAPSDLGGNKTVSRPASALVREKTPSTEDEVRDMLPPEMNPIARSTKRSMVLSQPSSRPWNLDESYPWDNKVDIDLSVPSQVHIRASNGDLRGQRKTRSLDLPSHKDTTNTTQGIDIGSIITARIDNGSITTEQATGFHTPHSRKHSKRSLIGSLTRKLKLGHRAAVEGSVASGSPFRSPHLRHTSSDVPHRPGDRYPTSGLTPPVNLNLDEVRSFFSDNSSEKERTGSFRKRLTHFKGKHHKSRRPELPGGRPRALSLDGSTTYDAEPVTLTNATLTTTGIRTGGANSAATNFGDNSIMLHRRAEFPPFKRFGEKLRQLLAKGGELIRSFSTRSRLQRRRKKTGSPQEDWLADSLYSNV